MVSGVQRGILVALLVGATVLTALFAVQEHFATGQEPHRSARPPTGSGYFATLPANSWFRLPGDGDCADRVRRSSWEPRPDNATPNATMPDAEEVKKAFARRPRARVGAYDPRWDLWLLPRVTGHHTGTTDENIQWAACKWGVADNLLRAIALRESSWFQYEVYPDGRCVLQHGCGDLVTAPTAASRVFCSELAARGRDYTADFGSGTCPRTFGIVGVMSWQAPGWGRMDGNQNGTFPFNRNSTAFALDYLGAFLRGCQEGWVRWLGARGAPYAPGRIWGCVGAWYAGDWWSVAARRYVQLVKQAEEDRRWLDPDWAELRPPCSTEHGCPHGSA